MREPTHCLPSAYQHFFQALDEIESDSGLARIATAIAMHHQPEAAEEEIFLSAEIEFVLVTRVVRLPFTSQNHVLQSFSLLSANIRQC